MNKSFLSLVSTKSFEPSQLFLNFVQNFEDCYDSKTEKLMGLDVSRIIRFTLKIQKNVNFKN